VTPLLPHEGRLCEASPDGTPGRPVALRGFNLSGAAKDPANRGLPFALADGESIVLRASPLLRALRDDGFNLLRIPLVWEFLAPDADVALREGSLEALRALVAHAGELGFRVILDIHQDVGGSFFHAPKKRSWHGDGFPRWLLERAYSPDGREKLPEGAWNDAFPFAWLPLARSWGLNYVLNGTLKRVQGGMGDPAVTDAFERFAARLAVGFRDLDNVLTYEPFNEPDSSTMGPDARDPSARGAYAALCAAVCRGLGDAVRYDRTPTCSPMPSGDWIDGTVLGFVPQLDAGLAGILRRSLLPVATGVPGRSFWLVTPHFYDIGEDAPVLRPHPERYDEVVASAAKAFEQWNVVPVVGEFGASSQRSGFRERHAAWVDAFERRGWSWCFWNLNPDAGEGGDDHWCGERFSAVERSAGLTETYRALLRPFPQRHGGPIRATVWHRDGARWRYEATFGKATVPGWRTEIVVPASLGEFHVKEGWPREGRVVTVGSDTADASVTIEP